MGARRKIHLAIASTLLVVATGGLIIVGERLAAAFFDLWKFSGYHKMAGIDVGANSSLIFLLISIFGVGACLPLAIRAVLASDRLVYQLAIGAAAVYVLNASVLAILIFSGLAYLFCGR